MAKKIEEYRAEVMDQSAVVCVVCKARVTVERAYAVRLEQIKDLFKGPHGLLQRSEIRVSNIDRLHGCICADDAGWIRKRGGDVFPLMQTIQLLAEARLNADEKIERLAREDAERKAREAELAKREREILSHFTFSEEKTADKSNGGSMRDHLIKSGLISPANGNGHASPEQAKEALAAATA